MTSTSLRKITSSWACDFRPNLVTIQKKKKKGKKETTPSFLNIGCNIFNRSFSEQSYRMTHCRAACIYLMEAITLLLYSTSNSHFVMTSLHCHLGKWLLLAAPSFTTAGGSCLIWQIFMLDDLLDATPKCFVSHPKIKMGIFCLLGKCISQ